MELHYLSLTFILMKILTKISMAIYMNNTFILLGSLNLVVTPKITFQSHVVYGQEAKMYLEKIGISVSKRGDTRVKQLNKMQ